MHSEIWRTPALGVVRMQSIHNVTHVPSERQVSIKKRLDPIEHAVSLRESCPVGIIISPVLYPPRDESQDSTVDMKRNGGKYEDVLLQLRRETSVRGDLHRGGREEAAR